MVTPALGGRMWGGDSGPGLEQALCRHLPCLAFPLPTRPESTGAHIPQHLHMRGHCPHRVHKACDRQAAPWSGVCRWQHHFGRSRSRWHVWRDSGERTWCERSDLAGTGPASTIPTRGTGAAGALGGIPESPVQDAPGACVHVAVKCSSTHLHRCQPRGQGERGSLNWKTCVPPATGCSSFCWRPLGCRDARVPTEKGSELGDVRWWCSLSLPHMHTHTRVHTQPSPSSALRFLPNSSAPRNTEQEAVRHVHWHSAHGLCAWRSIVAPS